MSRYRFVGSQEAENVPVAAACQVPGVSASAYYDWKTRERSGPSDAERAEAALLAKIRAIHATSAGT